MNARSQPGARNRRAAVAAVLPALVLSSLAVFGGVGLANGTSSAAQYQYGQYGKKVTICHKNKVTITVSVNALPAHKRHGDKVGTCAALRKAEKAKAEKAKAEKAKAEKEKAQKEKAEKTKEKAEKEKGKGKGKSESPPGQGQSDQGQGHPNDQGQGHDKGHDNDSGSGDDKGKGKKK